MTNLTFQVAKNGKAGRKVSAKSMDSIWNQYNNPLRKKDLFSKLKKARSAVQFGSTP